ncbi:MAG: hypothetical protein PVSMB1_10790 [Gemmatimonadaceae bacterium]
MRSSRSPIIGESATSEKVPGSVVYAGTINQSGTLEIVADRLGRDTSVGKIVDAVERAEQSRAPVQKTADRYAGYRVHFVLACAALTFALRERTAAHRLLQSGVAGGSTARVSL